MGATATLDEDVAEVPGGLLVMGSPGHYPEERPVRQVAVGPFRIDRTPVTNRWFARFVKASGYVTVAERPLDPAAYPGVEPRRLRPGALVFTPPRARTRPDGVHSWWRYVAGACWRRPEAKDNVFAGRLDHPVTCVAHADALAYARWAGKRLPTEAEWEWAARGDLVGATYAWGETWMPDGRRMANTWLGRFPDEDLKPRGARTTRVGSFPPNGYGLYDMIGNVWEWTDSWYHAVPSAAQPSSCCVPPEDSYDLDQPEIRIPRKVLKGGSFLCAENYCQRYRPAARQPQMIDTASVHIGFRCVADLPQAHNRA